MPYFPSPSDGASLYYADYRPRKRGPTTFATASPLTTSPPPVELKSHAKQGLILVFIHGWPMSHEMFAHLMLPLAHDYGLRCVAPDRRGFGRSEWNGAGARNKEITYETFAEDTLAVIQDAGVGTGGNPWVIIAASMVCSISSSGISFV
jgi:non-heme chloroperoxidase